MAAVPVTDARWQAEVLDVPHAVVVAFHATASSPCQAFGPILAEVAGQLSGRAAFLALNVEENAATAQRYDVSSLPTLLVFRSGRLTGRLIGTRPKERLLAELITHVS